MRRLSARGLVELAGSFSQRDRAIIETVARLRLVSGPQIERLFFTGTVASASRSRMTRRALSRLVEAGMLARTERRIGGVRAGAAGHVYYATGRGQRLVAYWHGEGLTRGHSTYEPSALFVRHTLAITEAFVRLREAERAGEVELLAFESEPDCWRPYVGSGGGRLFVKPDAFVRLGIGEVEARAWLELDCGTEGRAAVLRKCRSYLSYFYAGIETEVFPKVVWITTTQKRAGILAEVCASLPAEAWELFAVTTPERALDVLCGVRASS
jgi:hypothetical protein